MRNKIKRKKFRPVSKRNIDISMRAICEYSLTQKRDTHITEKLLYARGLPKSANAVQVAQTLAAMGLIEYKPNKYDGTRIIILTDKGKAYFENEAEKSRQTRHDWLVAIIPAILGALLSEPLWAFIRYVLQFLQEKS